MFNIKKQFLALVILSFLVSCAKVKSLPKQADKTPKSSLAFDRLIYDFGIAGQGKKISHTFKFTNTSPKPMKITKVNTSCGCTAALLSSKDIPPGGTGEIQAAFETRRYKGRQNKYITVYYNTPEKREIKLTIQGRIKNAEAVVEPQSINFGNIHKGETPTVRVRLLQLSQNNLVLKKIDVNEQYLTVKTSRFGEENSRGINIDAALKPDVPVGAFIEVITLNTNSNKRPRIDVPVWANILDKE